MTRHRTVLAGAALAALACASGCETAKSANATSPDIAGPIPGVVITAPRALEPSNGQQIEANGTPQTLLIENAGTTGPRALFLQVQLAADATFRQVLHEATRIEPGANGRTSYRLPDPLAPGYTYYWRARAADGANTGPYSEVSHFSVVEPVTIEAPTPLEPIGAIGTNRPTFKVRNGRVTGPAGDIVYRFEVGTSPAGPPAAVITQAPGSDGTTAMFLGDLPWATTIYWRAWATNGRVNSPFSPVVSFTTPPSPAGPAPSPPPGGGTPGGGSPLPSPVPPECGPGDPGNRIDCVRAVAAVSVEWDRCRAGSGVHCHRFTRQVVYALSRSDPNWKLIQAAPGGHACNCSSCGPSDGTMFREDTTVYAGRQVYDMITGAGGPSPSLSWSPVEGPRPGDTPADAPVCR